MREPEYLKLRHLRLSKCLHTLRHPNETEWHTTGIHHLLFFQIAHHILVIHQRGHDIFIQKRKLSLHEVKVVEKEAQGDLKKKIS